MKLFRFFAVGVLFGITLTKAEAISWYRIYEMFMFQSFHMYGIISVAIFVGVIGIRFIKKRDLKDYEGQPIELHDKDKSIARYLFGGFMFGLGWALVGACPGPIFILLGTGVPAIAVVLFGALLGTYAYGLLKDKLPH
ncbi:MAG: YeeE/YedE thiosulfate transporter family protein [Limnohabitans sp.]|nr:YeeE/YedE thiosulfate transporter family protein [Limnohabitans sp.]